MPLAAAAVIIALAAADAASPAACAEAAAREVLDRRYQQQLPIATPGKRDGKDPSGATPRQPPGRDRTPRRPDGRLDDELRGGAFGGIVRGIVYVVLAIALAMLILWFARDLRRGPADATLAGEPVPEPTVDQGVIERPVGDADELARAGRYAEAIHTLLLRTLTELVRATRTRVPAALTSREILERVPLVPDARVALHGLVSAVEVSWFGDDVPAAGEYQSCREQFQRFADAYRGRT